MTISPCYVTEYLYHASPQSNREAIQMACATP